MRPIALISRVIFFFFLLVLFNSCGEDITGTFYFSDEARKYQIDTTITSFKMIDNHGITDEFVMDKYNWYQTHHYFSQWGTHGDASGETYGIAYNSVLNSYMFMYVLRADVDYTSLEIEWNQKDHFVYDFSSRKVISGIVPLVSFYDSLLVRGVWFRNIIDIDYSGKVNEIDKDTPVRTYISGG